MNQTQSAIAVIAAIATIVALVSLTSCSSKFTSVSPHGAAAITQAELRNKLGEEYVSIGIHKMTRNSSNAIEQPWAHPSTIKKIKFKDFLNYKKPAQVKHVLSIPPTNKFDKYFVQKIKNSKFSNLIDTSDQIKIRICTNPWKFPMHFDCTENFSVLLYGKKKFTTMDMFTNKKDEEEFLLNTVNKSAFEINNLYPASQTKILTAMTGISIPCNKYHSVESVDDSGITILINFINLSDKNKEKECLERWNPKWAKQNIKCITNQCLDT